MHCDVDSHVSQTIQTSEEAVTSALQQDKCISGKRKEEKEERKRTFITIFL